MQTRGMIVVEEWCIVLWIIYGPAVSESRADLHD